MDRGERKTYLFALVSIAAILTTLTILCFTSLPERGKSMVEVTFFILLFLLGLCMIGLVVVHGWNRLNRVQVGDSEIPLIEGRPTVLGPGQRPYPPGMIVEADPYRESRWQ